MLKTAELSTLEVCFNQLISALITKTTSTEQFTVKLGYENSQFTRFNHAKVRQTGEVQDGWVELTLMKNQCRSFRQFPFTGNWEIDWQRTYTALEELREELPLLPLDPYLVLPAGNHTSREVNTGKLLPTDTVVPSLLAPVSGLRLYRHVCRGICD